MLQGYRVLDCSGRLGWLAGRLLADMGADVVKIEPLDFEAKSTAWRAFNVNKRLLRLDHLSNQKLLDLLLKKVDILIETSYPDSEESRYFNADRLAHLNPNLVHVSITPFGHGGPRCQWRGDDLQIMASGGAMSLAGEPGGKPLRISVPQAHAWAGAQAAIGALIALLGRGELRSGQHVDVSAQAAVVLALSHAPAFWDLDQGVPSRAGAFITGRSIHGGRFRAFWPCRDGYINFALYGGVAGCRTNRQLTEWIKEAGKDVGMLASVDWDQFDPTKTSQAEIDILEEPIGLFFQTITKREFLEEANRREMLGYPVFTVADISQDPQLASRGFWDELRQDGVIEKHVGSFALINGERAQIRYLAGTEVAFVDYLSELEESTEVLRKVGKDVFINTKSQALSGLKVIEFSAYAAGPHVGKILANFGATVIHVESRQRPDGFRLQYPPFYKGEKGINSSGCFAMYNDSKYGVTLDLKNPHGLDLARKLVCWADVVVENMRPGVLKKLGLGYEELAKINPRIIMLSSCNMGQTGPRAYTPGFGSQLSALAGFCGLTGERNSSPMLLYGPYIDFIASSLGTIALLSAIVRQRQENIGAYIDLAQYEAGLHFLADALFDYHQRGIVAERMGNSTADAVPHEAYQCKNNEWVVISCSSDNEFAILCDTIGRPDLISDFRFVGLINRRQQVRELDSIIGKWAEERNADDIAALLQEEGVSAYRVNNIADVFRDPQLVTRGIWRTRIHGKMGPLSSYFSAFELAKTPGDVFKAAPCLGADNEFVFRELLGLDVQTFEMYSNNNAFD